MSKQVAICERRRFVYNGNREKRYGLLKSPPMPPQRAASIAPAKSIAALFGIWMRFTSILLHHDDTLMSKAIFLSALLLTACTTSPASPPDPTPTPAAEQPEATPTFSSNPFQDGLNARRNGDYARAAVAFQYVLASNPTPELASDALFRLAEAHYLKKDYARAIDAFNAFLRQYPNHARAVSLHYFLADAYRAQKDWSNALAEYQLFRAQTPTLAGDTDAAIADVLAQAGDSDNALKQYARALEDTTLAPLTRFNVLLRYADLHQARGEPALAAKQYDDALPLAPDAKNKAEVNLKAGEAYAAANQLDAAIVRWNAAINQTPEQPAAYKALVNLLNRSAKVDDFQRGLVNYHAASYDAAIAAFERELKEDKTRVGEIRWYLGNAHSRNGTPTPALAEFDFIIKNLPKDKRVADAYMAKAGVYVTQGRTDDAVSAYKKFVTALPDDARADDALLRAAQLLDRAKRYGDALEIYQQIQTKYPTRETAVEALFWLGFIPYRQKDYKTAQTRWQLLAQNHPQSNYYTRALYWAGKAAHARGLNEEARKLWTQASAHVNDVDARHWRAYYAWRARDALSPRPANDARLYDSARYAMNRATDRAEFEAWLARWAKPANGAPGTLAAATQTDMRFRRGVELMNLDHTVEARLQFSALITAKQDDPPALYALALYFQEHNQFRPALDAAEKLEKLATTANASPAPRFLRALIYPAYYNDLVIEEARKNKIDPALYLALIHHESRFNPWATAEAGERGLGQIIPPTAKSIAQSLKIKDFDLDTLFLPYVNVRFGVWYLAQDYAKYNDPIYALAAYNAGVSRVERWKRPDVDVALEEFEIASTQWYVRVIYSNWRQYQEIYK